jgi:WhiB family transcriptional regulator, redox-sensing transcriptional regulator
MNLKDCAHKKLAKTQVCATCTAPKGWEHFAQCTIQNLDAMYPDDSNVIAVAKAKRICSNCPVKGFCLELGWNEDYGIWGGFTSNERKRLRKVFDLKHKEPKEIRKMIRTIAHRMI